MLFHPAALSWTRRFAMAAAVIGATAATTVTPAPPDPLAAPAADTAQGAVEGAAPGPGA